MIRQTRLFLGVAAALGALAPAATAQVTTPPPRAPEPEPAYVPPPQPVARPAPATPRPRPDAGGGASTPIPEHEALAVVGEDGRVVRLEGILDEIALQRNPLVSGAKNDDINAMRVRRRAQAEKMVIENLDLFREVESGVINNIALANFEEFQRVVQKIPPLVITGSLSSQLADEGVLTRVQSQSTNQIVRMYNSAVSEELEKEFGESYLDHFMKFIINESLKDSRFAYAGLIDEMVANADDLVKMDLSPNARKAVERAKSVQGDPDAPRLVRADLDKLDIEELQDLLRAVRDRRADPDQPPLEKLDFHTAGTTIISEGGSDQRMVKVRKPDGTIGVVSYKSLDEGAEYEEHGVTKIKGQEGDQDGADASDD